MLHLIFWVFILVLGLSYFGISIQAIINSPAGQANVAYLSNLLLQLWHWLLPYIQPLISAIQNLKF
ncbi:MAG TPA: hypothetical protein VF803_01100 [Candidatus Paceibacterota bacterium]